MKTRKIKTLGGYVTKQAEGLYEGYHSPTAESVYATTEQDAKLGIEEHHANWLYNLSPLDRGLYDLGLAAKALAKANSDYSDFSKKHPPIGYHTLEYRRVITAARKTNDKYQKLKAKVWRMCLAEAKRLAKNG